MDWLPEGHLAYFVLEIVRELDLEGIEGAIQSKDGRGERPYSPRMMTSLILYAYCTGTFSSRKIERATHEDVAVRVIAAGAHPHWTTINSFRLDHRVALSQLFVQVLRLCARSGLKTLGHVALDGSKVQANASKHKAMSYERMKEDEARLTREIEELMRRADEVDAREDFEYGANCRGDELPAELQRRESRLQRIREAKAALEKEAAESRAAALRDNASALRAKTQDRTVSAREKKTAVTLAAQSDAAADKLSPRDDDDDDGGGSAGASELPKHRVQATPDGVPKPKAQRNFTDPESRIMIRNGVFLQAFNAQAAVSEDQIIVAHGLTNDGTDAQLLAPMVERVVENCGELPKILTADTGYLSEANITYCAKNGVDAYIPARKADAAKLIAIPDTEALISHWAMQDKVTSARGRKIYALRKILVEPVFGQIKSAMGFRRFSLRGLQKAACEWGFVCACHNLLKAFRVQQRRLAM
jgi:transposase